LMKKTRHKKCHDTITLRPLHLNDHGSLSLLFKVYCKWGHAFSRTSELENIKGKTSAISGKIPTNDVSVVWRIGSTRGRRPLSSYRPCRWLLAPAVRLIPFSLTWIHLLSCTMKYFTIFYPIWCIFYQFLSYMM
jgi:hypothetical protein